MKKRKVIVTLLASLMMTSLMTGVVKAEGNPYITNGSFESAIDKNEIQLYKAVRTNEKASEGRYSIKVGNPKPTDESQVPIWRYNYGKGSVNVVIHNVEPNTSYKVKIRYFNETGVKMSTGVLDIEGKHTTSPWQLASNIKTNSTISTDWKTNEHTITTGPRTNEIYAFAYMEWTGNDLGSGVFYVDDVEIEKVSSNAPTDKTSIGYTASSTEDFPLTVPAIQKFEKKENKVFTLNPAKQIFSTDEFSKEKTQYLADCLVEKGIIKSYQIKIVSDIDKAEGIVLMKKPISFTLPDNIKESKIDAYQIDIQQNRIVVQSDYIEGLQNGSMTLLQAFTQRKSLPTGMVQDYSDQVVRGLQVDSGRRYYSIAWLKEQVEQMAYYKQNKLQLRLKDNEGIRYDSRIATSMVDKKGGYWKQAEVDDLVNYAKKFNIEVIPEIDFPGHAEQDASFYKDWGLGGSTKALDFSKDEVREYMISIYKEAADFFHAKTIHIGGDEFFQSGYTTAGKQILTDWAKDQTGNANATDYDAIKLFFNESADILIKKGLKVLVWNDNIFDLEGIVPLDRRIVVDFWAGGMYGSIKAQDTATAGYKIMSSSSSNYHDLWPQQGNSKLDRPLPKALFEQFTRYNYSKASYNYGQDEILTKDLGQSLGQVFPIWDDAHGYIPEYILTRTLFPRYAGFAMKTWGVDYKGSLSYEEFERLMYAVGAPKNSLFKQSKINYNEADLDAIIGTIGTALDKITTKDTGVLKNIDQLKATLKDVKDNKANYLKDSFYTDIIDKIIYDYENINYVDVNKSQLDVTITIAETVSEKDLANVIPAVAKEFKAALQAARTIFQNGSATQKEVNDVFQRLSLAMQKLSYVKGDKKNLNELIGKINTLNKKDYTESTWNILVSAMDVAQKVVKDENAVQTDIEKAYDTLLKAFLRLRLEPADKTMLSNKIKEAEALSQDKYTVETWRKLETALTTAKKVIANEKTTVTEIDNAFVNLETAITGLILKDNQSVDKDNNDKNNSGVKTEDSTHIIPMLGGLGLSLAAIMYIFMKKKQANHNL